ncbi:hypothetical protein C0431_13080 [bacterium]|nr:hypothetical protein [bacterium]
MIEGIMIIENTLLEKRASLEKLIQQNARTRSEVEAILEIFPDSNSWAHVASEDAKHILRACRAEARVAYKAFNPNRPSDKDIHPEIVRLATIHFDERRETLVDSLAKNETHLNKLRST